MRNLKKILALVLALIMSLSLMVTAGAKDFPDSDGISNDAYALAVDILSDLDVFNGDQNGNFNPTADITRAEVAAIIYRIATGDVGVDGYKTYAPYNQFKDINVEDWYAGYVTYCANAGYIKGRNTGNFDAKDPVTGYEVLAMILRAVGYDKNNEFVGSNWQLNTASIATEKGVLANILKDGTVRLSEPATRQVVAEMLFRAIFIDMVDWNAATLSYTSNGKTLAKENLDTESVTGVVMANEWANINKGGTVVLAEGKTELLPEGETKNLTLDVPSELDAVGCTYNAYIQGGTKVLGELEYDEDLNTVNFNNGKKSNVYTLAGDLDIDKDTAYYLNYSENFVDYYVSEHLIRYAIAESSCGSGTGSYKEYITGLNQVNPTVAGSAPVAGHTYETRSITINGTATNCYVVAIQPGYAINTIDMAIMQKIFYTADRLNETLQTGTDRDYVTGEVYVGTNSTQDVSDWIDGKALSWNEFKETYLTADGRYSYAGCENGESLRVIDNNADGVADYIFKIQYWQDKAINTYKDALEFYVLDLSDYDYETWADEIAVGDVVNYTSIDSRVTVYKAEKLTGKVTEKSFKDTTILTTANDTVYGQSEITNNTYMDERIMETEDETEYNFYLDEFDFIRTYELAQGSQYALITELYSTTNQAYNYVNNGRYIVEAKLGEAELDEYTLANPGTATNPNPFINESAWTSRATRYTNSDLNFLQPAIAHLGISSDYNTNLFVGATTGLTPAYAWNASSWNRGVFQMVNSLGTTAAGDYGVFDYGSVDYPNYTGAGFSVVAGTADHSFSFTNVAAYTLDEDGNISLRSASKLMTDKNGDQLYYWNNNDSYVWKNPTKYFTGIGAEHLTWSTWLDWWMEDQGITDYNGNKAVLDAALKACLVPAYAVDYVQLQKEDIAAGKNHFYIDSTYSSNFLALDNGYVNATVETEFYIAMPDGVLYQIGYDKLPTIKADKVRAAYAVASNSTNIWDAESYDYWIANVIVIEVDALATPYESISLMYYNPNEISGSTRYVESLNNQWRAYQPDSEEEAHITVVPKRSNNGGTTDWGNQSWSNGNYGFYEVSDSEYADGTLTAGDVTKLSTKLGATDWAAHHIYAGTIQRVWGLTTSEYIDVDYLGRSTTDPGAPFNDRNVESVTVTTSTSAVPIYRVNAQSTTDLRLGLRVAASDVTPGDEIILVYDRTGTTLSYIVDLGYRKWSSTSIYDPSSASSNVHYLWDNYQAILFGQQTSTSEVLEFNLVLGVGESLTFSYDGVDQETYDYTDTIGKLTIPADMAIVTFEVKMGAGTNPAAFIGAVAGDWVVDSTSYDATTRVLTVKMINRSVSNAGKAALAIDATADGTIFTAAGLTSYISSLAGEDDLDTLYTAKTLLTAVAATGLDGTYRSQASTALTTPTTGVNALYTTAKTAAVTAATSGADGIDNYESTAISSLPAEDQAKITEAKTAATNAINAANTQADIDEAVKIYEETVDLYVNAQLSKPLEGEALTTAQAAAKAELDAYKTAAVAALDSQTAVTAAKNTAITAINTATTQKQLNDAVKAYKTAIDAAVAVTVTFTAANATVQIENDQGAYVTGSTADAEAGDTVSFKVTANDGYAISSVTQGDATLTDTAGVYTTKALDGNTTITVTTRKLEGQSVSVMNPASAAEPSHLKVSPTVAEAALLSLVTLELTADEGYVLPAAAGIVAVTVNGNMVDAAASGSGNGWWHTESAGKITITFVGTAGNAVVSGPIVVYAAGIAKAASLTVANPADGTITEPTVASGLSVKYMVVSADPSTTISGWTVETTSSTVESDLGDSLATKAGITLTAADNGKFLVAVALDGDNKVVSAGSVKIAYAKAAALTVANPATGTITAPTTGTGETAYYGVTNNKTAPDLSSITVMDATTAVTAVSLSTTVPNLTAASDGEYLVVAVVKDSKIVKIGSKEIALDKPTEITEGISVATGTGVITVPAAGEGNSWVYVVYDDADEAEDATSTWNVLTAGSTLSGTSVTSGTTAIAKANAGKYVVLVKLDASSHVIAFGGCTIPSTID